ncbi:MAG: IMP dehydrogenase, partial [Spirochaetae bacterium HGW-Spirochaetae-10]
MPGAGSQEYTKLTDDTDFQINAEDLRDGFSAEEMFAGQTGLTYKDFIVLPGFIDFHPSEVDLDTQL